jgi:hypothetical protein
MNLKRPSRLALAALVTVTLAVGCGASKAPRPHGSAEAATVGSLRADAEAVCARINTQLTTRLPAHVSPRTIARITSANAALEKRAVVQLSSLTAPPSLRTKWDALLEDRRTLATLLGEYGTAEERGQGSQAKALLGAKRIVRGELRGAANSGGFVQCGRLG